jgi:hypothetical protein
MSHEDDWNTRGPHTFPISWATSWGDDEYGVWCALNNLRFRFIETANRSHDRGFWVSPPVEGLATITQPVASTNYFGDENAGSSLAQQFRLATSDEIRTARSYLDCYGFQAPEEEQGSRSVYVVFPDVRVDKRG